jgi:hypothetical protein
MKAQLGDDAPKALDSAQTSGDLLTIIQSMIVERTQDSERMEVEITTIRGTQKSTKAQMLQILKGSRGRYPVDGVPQLRLPTLP